MKCYNVGIEPMTSCIDQVRRAFVGVVPPSLFMGPVPRSIAGPGENVRKQHDGIEEYDAV
jgi:hypothetical protein